MYIIYMYQLGRDPPLIELPSELWDRNCEYESRELLSENRKRIYQFVYYHKYMYQLGRDPPLIELPSELWDRNCEYERRELLS